jgi:branched-chain amino acid transport system permease protein
MVQQVAALISDGVLLGLIYTLTGLGLSLVLGVMGIVNVAHSAFVMLGSFLAFELFRRLGIDPIIAFALAIPIFFVLGAIIYRVIITRVERAPQTQSLVAMFGLMVLIENLGTIIWTTDTRVITASYTNTSSVIGGVVIPHVRLIAGLLSLLLVGMLWAFMRFSLTGRAIRAMGQDRNAASSVGIDISRLSTFMFGLGIACAGAAGVALAMAFPFAPNTQVQWLAWGFLVVILGGLGRVESTLAAGIAVGMIQTVSTAIMPFYYVYFVLYSLLAFILIVRREGLANAQRRTI